MQTARSARRPRFRELTPVEMRALLGEQRVGRLAFAWRGHVDVRPIHYVFDGAAIYLRTAPGTKLLALRHSPWVAFEVDDVRDTYDWRSVVVHGTVYAVRARGTAAQRALRRRAVDLLRAIEPDALTADDPVRGRDVVLRLDIDRMTGRIAAVG
ncbi:Pyridoxamine 5'-phosphate oxidase-related protein [Gemmatirosa kalamazoonensis]|uniref:Pyridoxamine 5'-phosphate oxidase-related protein n=1 Tax=Gemmatirosa kalamazoonensis TaxID=861299 RepID=W0RFZ4_9BACT|nr:pyridoxamine 5'-phosphate oxidase family protein [Gemmatirosa kalamazoonensis]AHG89357.1 Pyridoxamine 5'-phosphate oxidase-related protein [Gemmatirosa kalamazoonensis]